MNRIQKIAFRADEKVSLARTIQVAETEECTVVYIIGNNPERISGLRAAGLTVHQVETLEALPADVFHWYKHSGFWAAIHTEKGYVRMVDFSEDSLMAEIILKSKFTPEYAKEFHVRPVEVNVLEGF